MSNKWTDRLSSTQLIDRLGLEDTVLILQCNRHVLLKDDSEWVKRFFFVVEGVSPTCRPKADGKYWAGQC